MSMHIVRVVGTKWYRNGYIGSYDVDNCVEALRRAGKDKDIRKLTSGRVVRVEAIKTTDLE